MIVFVSGATFVMGFCLMEQKRHHGMPIMGILGDSSLTFGLLSHFLQWMHPLSCPLDYLQLFAGHIKFPEYQLVQLM